VAVEDDLRQRRVPGNFGVGMAENAHFYRWELGFNNPVFAISHGPGAAAPSTPSQCSALSRHAVVPSRFRTQVRWVTRGFLLPNLYPLRVRHVDGPPVLGLLRALRPTHRPSANDAPTALACLEGGRGTGTEEWFPRSPQTDERRRCPALPQRLRHGYAADLHHGLPAGFPNPTQESPAPRHRNPAPIARI
jgi:hypothetical protein